MIHVYVSRVTREVDEVVGMKQEISYDDLGKMGYLSQVRLSNAWKEKGDKVPESKVEAQTDLPFSKRLVPHNETYTPASL